MAIVELCSEQLFRLGSGRPALYENLANLDPQLNGEANILRSTYVRTRHTMDEESATKTLNSNC